MTTARIGNKKNRTGPNRAYGKLQSLRTEELEINFHGSQKLQNLTKTEKSK